MRSECMPTVTLTIRPMVQAICQHMGLENNELAEAIRSSVEYETKKMMMDIPKMVKEEVYKMFNEAIHEECDSYARSWMNEKWVRENKDMVTDFRNTIRCQVSIAVGNLIEENRKLREKKNK